MKPIMLGLVVALASFAFADKSVLKTVTAKNIGQGVEIAIKGVSLKNPKVLSLNNGTSYVVQFEAHLAGKAGRIKVKHAGVDYVQYVWYRSSPATVRVHVKHDKSYVPELVEEDGDYFIRFNVETRPRAPSVKDADEMKKAIALLGASESSGAALFERPKSELEKVIENVRPGLPLAQQVVETGVSIAGDPSSRPSAALDPTPTAPAGAANFGSAADNVTLTFSDTDVVLILQGLASQAKVNIATAPNISPSDSPLKLTISLTDVPLEDALRIVSSLAGLRYGRVGNTYIVTPAADFNKTMTRITGADKNYTTRVVSLVSGEAEQIRDATFKAIPQDGEGGYYEIMVPSDSVAAVGAFAIPPEGAAGAVEGLAGGAAAPGIAGPPARQRSFYLILVGEQDRLDEIEYYVESLDTRIARSFSLDRAANIGTAVVPILSGQTERIKTMLLRLLAANPRQDEYSIDEASISELSEAEAPTKVILMAGPKEELATLKMFAIALDDDLCEAAGIDNNRDPEARKKIYAVVDLMYIEPKVAEFDLKNRIRGLHVTVMPDPVSPGLIGEARDKKQSTPGSAEEAGPAEETAEQTRQVGLEPMRLILRGTPAQIRQAREYIALVDIAPRQVAIELRVMELTKEEALQVGLDWSLLSAGRLDFIRINQGLPGTSASAGNISATFNDGGSSSGSVLARLDKLANSRNLIARPNALVTDGRSAHLFVGDTIRYVKSIIASQNGTTVEIDEVQVGVTVDIMVRIGANGQIALDLQQNFSLLNGFTAVPGGGQIPQTSDRKASMFVNMEHGETIALGGLIQDQDRKKVSGIPLLMNLPIIGQFFRRTDNSRVRTEIVFFLTAVVVDRSNRANAASPANSLKETPDPQGDYFGNRGDGKGDK